MKKYVIYLSILALGLILGWFLFGNSSEKDTNHNHDKVSATNDMWTCSMHPQIMKTEAGDCPICGMDLIPVQSNSDGLLADQFRLTENAMALANIQTSIVGEGTINNSTVNLSGKIAENEETNTVQVSYFSGRIERLYVNATGESINKGQLLATIYSPELYAAQQELMTSASLKASQPNLYRAVRNKLKLWKLSESQINQIEASGKILENVPVYATVSGTVTEKLVMQGDYIKQGEPLLKVANLKTVWANFDVYESQINLFKKGQEVSLFTSANPNQEFKGTVDFIDPVLNTNTRTVKLRVVLNNSKNSFKPGMFVQGKIEGNVNTENPVLTIPETSVMWTGTRSLVYVKLDSNTPVFEMRTVTLGTKIGEQYEVVSGLKPGEEIVTNGTFTVDAAAQLQGKKSMMNASAEKQSEENKSNNQDVLVSEANPLKRMPVSEDFQKQLRKVYNNYISIKNALVSDDSEKAKLFATQLLEAFNGVDGKLLNDANVKKQWLAFADEIKTTSSFISKSLDIKMQRNHFKKLSLVLKNAVTVFGVKEKVFVEFCPMANDNNGAYWLSKDEAILNPYFGDAMITCGEVKQIIE
ncbi:efflux RND transporter periplasmic adaptor subunit [Siansivirga zeaxanthinifaciens]|uniref:RND transporter n=1 Tax=Siansivirga zeaxanthinifaciens CC-SAMT-1 TaxID=1454006 RepID=A0A0C5W5A9_9FLAO|nr:efflux RND transporter periplasmic adaptor subunit [Siansivirga zeaxanthinifaciens]AJR02313.1 RND transporter [Siansivirga zeaxanthinifaciens CC-SAMT-1]